MHFGSLIESFESIMNFTKKIPKFGELNSFSGVQQLKLSGKLYLLGIWMKSKQWGDRWFEYSVYQAKQVILMLPWT